jgi:predicted AlkP superfamily phosphohydrolase/phosphomutase
LGVRRFNQVKGEFESALLTSTVAWEKTRAYSLGAGGNIFINVKGREPAGTVEPGEKYDRLCQELIGGLMRLSDPETGAPVVEHVYRREELYHGPLLHQAPDLIIQWKDYGYWGRGRYDSSAPVFEAQRHLDFSDQPLTGSHRPEGILILQGAGVRSAAQIDGAHLSDLLPTILGLMEVPIPTHVDGSILYEAFVEGAIEKIGSLSVPSEVPSLEDEFTYTPEDEAKISQHLRDLGYL